MGVGVGVAVGVGVGVGVGCGCNWINSMRPPLPNWLAWTAFALPATYCPSARHVDTESRAREVDRTDQVHVAIEHHYFRPIMELRTPRSKSHHCAVVVGFRANRCALKRTSAGHGVGTDHLGTGDIEQEDLAREPVREIPGKGTYCGAVSRNYGSPAEPVIGLTEVNHSLVGGPIKLVNIEVEPIGDKHVPIARDPVKDVPGAGACDAE